MHRLAVASWGLPVLAVLASVLLIETRAADKPPARVDTFSPLKLTGALLAKGSQFLPRALNIETHIIAPIYLGPVNVNLGLIGSSSDSEVRKEHERRNSLLAEQNRLHKQNIDLQVRFLDYQKARDEALLRKPRYEVPGNKLLVVVADFSSGNPEEGCEVADEIAVQLGELKKAGIEMHVLVGEMKKGVVIRNEEMAQDLGNHFPAGTNFLVLWGTMSPRTMGRYRPHVTAVQKTAANQGIAISYSLDLDAQQLPNPADQVSYQRECYERLIGASCAAVPGLYAAHELSHDRVPDLARYYSFLGEDSGEAKRLQEQVQRLARWARGLKSNGRTDLHRVSAVSSDTPYPRLIHSKRDDTLMALITDTKGQPRYFENRKSKKKEIVYIDVFETGAKQFADFLTSQGNNKEEGGAKWVNLDGEYPQFLWDAEKKCYSVKEYYPSTPGYDQASPVVAVSWFGAKSYCRWAGKDLPTSEEWRAAAQPEASAKYPWGNEPFSTEMPQCNGSGAAKYYRKVGAFQKDRSAIGCFDMAGNVSEWCDDWFDEAKGQRVTCGGCYSDTEPKYFETSAQRGVEQVKQPDGVGFRGVVRIPVDG